VQPHTGTRTHTWGAEIAWRLAPGAWLLAWLCPSDWFLCARCFLANSNC